MRNVWSFIEWRLFYGSLIVFALYVLRILKWPDVIGRAFASPQAPPIPDLLVQLMAELILIGSTLFFVEPIVTRSREFFGPPPKPDDSVASRETRDCTTLMAQVGQSRFLKVFGIHSHCCAKSCMGDYSCPFENDLGWAHCQHHTWNPKEAVKEFINRA